MPLRKLAALTFTLLLSSLAFASQSLIPEWLEVMPAGSDETKPIAHHILHPSTPNGKGLRANPPECSNGRLDQLLAQGSPGSQSQVGILQDFFNRCEKIISRFSPTKLGAVLSLVDQNYTITERPELSEVVFKLSFNITIHGLLALKPSSRPRPMIIVVAGTGGDLSDIGTRAMLGPLFDETPFNVLILPSSTGSQFISDNHVLALGGFEEARMVFEVTKLLAGADSPYRNLISSFHVAGVSLGGNTALFTGVYATYNPLPADAPQIQSILGYCPAVDLETSIDDLDRKDFTGRTYRHIIEGNTIGKRNLLGDLTPEPLPVAPRKLGYHDNVKFAGSWLYPSLQDLVKRSNFLIAPFTVEKPETAEAYWFNNNFLNFANTIEIPTILFVSSDDFVVNPENNSLALDEKLKLYRSESPISIFHAKKGWHCLMSEVYGEDLFSTSVRRLILDNSPEFKVSKVRVPFSDHALARLKGIGPRGNGEKFFGYYWHVTKGETEADLVFQIWTPQRVVNQTSFCDRTSPFSAFEGCFRHDSIKVALNTFGLNPGKQGVASRPQAEALTRWLNSHVTAHSPSGFEPVDTTIAPAYFEWVQD